MIDIINKIVEKLKEGCGKNLTEDDDNYSFCGQDSFGLGVVFCDKCQGKIEVCELIKKSLENYSN